MTLQTWEEEDLLRRVKRCEQILERLERICAEILEDMQPQYEPTVNVTVIPDA